jgi:hypothetical protein
MARDINTYQHIHPGLEREKKTEQDQHGDLNLPVETMVRK